MYFKQIFKYLFYLSITAMAFFIVHTADLAEAIVKYREKSGFFKKPEDLLNVPGITKEVYEKLNPQVGTEGDLYCVPKEGSEEDEDEDEDEEEPILSPSKC